MDVFDGSDPNEESQATQLLQELLDNNSSPIKNPSENHSSALRIQTVQPNEISSDSLPSSRTSNSLPHYHFHGLASTQTQSQQHGEDEEINEGSQKENIGTSKPSHDHGHVNPAVASRPGSPNATSSRNIPAKATQLTQRKESVPVNQKVTNKKTSTTVSFPSPPKTDTAATKSKPVTRQSPYKPTLQPSRYRPVTRRSSSEDSFAHDPENNEELFMAKAEQFMVPLSELGKGVSSSRDRRNATGGTSNSYMFQQPSGRVLVEATPSQSESSQNQEPPQVNQHYIETQISEEMEHMNNRGSDKEDNFGGSDSEPSSSYRRMLRGGHNSDPEPMEATQPSTQVEDSNIPAFNTAQSPFNSAQSPFSYNPSLPVGASTSNAQSGPRSLLGLVNPDLRYRYRGFEHVPSSVQPSGRTAGPSNQQQFRDSGRHGTEESFPVQRVASPVKGPVVPTGRSNKPSSSNKRGLPVGPSSRSCSPLPMDVVPDSEPSRRNVEPSTSRLQGSATTRPGQSRGQNAPLDFGDVTMGPPPNQMAKPAPPDIEDEEEDIPLAAVAVKRPRGRPPKNPGSKGKGVTEARGSANTVEVSMPATKEQKGQSGTAAGKKSAQTKVTAGSWQTGVVPSSVPEQDAANEPLVNVTRPNKSIDSKKKLTEKKPPNSRQSSRSTSAAPKSHLVQRGNARDSNTDKILTGKGDKDDDTELADEEEYQDDTEEVPGPSRKRKRAAQTRAVAVVKDTRGAGKRIKREAATPGTQQAKKLRATASTTTRTLNTPGSRVFALWKQDGHYYPGIVHAAEPNSCYTITFDDGTTGEVNIEQMRLCRLKVGDDVLFPGRSRPTRIISFDEDSVDGAVQVKVDDVVQDVPIRDLRIANKTILYDWADRVLTLESITTTVKPARPKLSPSPSKMSVLSIPSVRGTRKKVLSKTGLIVTLSATNRSWEKEKEKVMSAVKNSGGFVIDDLSTILFMEGKHSSSNNRWIIKKEDVKWVGDQEITRLFLLADDPNQKPKFLTALALGIPCLSTSWLHDSVESSEEKDWTGYMLPQGFSPVLNARPSQQIDVDWGNSVHQLKDILSNTVPCKLFAHKSILCVGPEMVYHPKGKRRATVEDKAQEATNAIPQIILAMGADRVEAITEPRYATSPLKDYDYLVIRGHNSYLPQFSECVTVHWAWVKECLIASRYLPLPSWNLEDSQET